MRGGVIEPSLRLHIITNICLGSPSAWWSYRALSTSARPEVQLRQGYLQKVLRQASPQVTPPPLNCIRILSFHGSGAVNTIF